MKSADKMTDRGLVLALEMAAFRSGCFSEDSPQWRAQRERGVGLRKELFSRLEKIKHHTRKAE